MEQRDAPRSCVDFDRHPVIRKCRCVSRVGGGDQRCRPRLTYIQNSGRHAYLRHVPAAVFVFVGVLFSSRSSILHCIHTATTGKTPAENVEAPSIGWHYLHVYSIQLHEVLIYRCKVRSGYSNIPPNRSNSSSGTFLGWKLVEGGTHIHFHMNYYCIRAAAGN